MKKIITLIFMIVLTLSISNNTLNANVEKEVTENTFKSLNSIFIENENEIVIGNTAANKIDNKYLVDSYYAGKTIVLFSDKGYSYDIFYGEEFFDSQVVIYKLINEQKYVYTYSTEANDREIFDESKIFDLRSSMWDFYLEKTEEINELKSNQNILSIINLTYYTSKTLSLDELEVESCMWTQRYNQQKTADFAPYGRTTSTITGFRCTIDTTDYWYVKVTNEYNIGKVLQYDPIIGSNYYGATKFSDAENIPVAMTQLKIYRRSQYIGSNMYLYGDYPKHGFYFPMNSNTQTTVTNSFGEEVGASLSGTFNPTTFTGEVGMELSILQSFTHNYTYLDDTPDWNASQTGTISNDGYLAYLWTFDTFVGDIDVTEQTLVREFGAMFSVKTTEDVRGAYVDLYVFTKFDYLGFDINKSTTHYRVLLT